MAGFNQYQYGSETLVKTPLTLYLNVVEEPEGDAHGAGGGNAGGEALGDPQAGQQVPEQGRGEKDDQLEDAKHKAVLRGRGSLQKARKLKKDETDREKRNKIDRRTLTTYR